MIPSIVYKPVLTEKSLTLATSGWFTFAVDAKARKEQIASEIAKRYKVTVVNVRTVAMPAKVRRVGKKRLPMTEQSWKKALVKLKQGQTIEAFTLTQEAPVEAPAKKK